MTNLPALLVLLLLLRYFLAQRSKTVQRASFYLKNYESQSVICAEAKNDESMEHRFSTKFSECGTIRILVMTRLVKVWSCLLSSVLISAR